MNETVFLITILILCVLLPSLTFNMNRSITPHSDFHTWQWASICTDYLNYRFHFRPFLTTCYIRINWIRSPLLVFCFWYERVLFIDRESNKKVHQTWGKIEKHLCNQHMRTVFKLAMTYMAKMKRYTCADDVNTARNNYNVWAV